MHKDKWNIPANMSEQDKWTIRAVHAGNQNSLWMYMALEVFHKAKLTVALDKTYFVDIPMGNTNFIYDLVQEVFVVSCFETRKKCTILMPERNAKNPQYRDLSSQLGSGKGGL